MGGPESYKRRAWQRSWRERCGSKVLAGRPAEATEKKPAVWPGKRN